MTKSDWENKSLVVIIAVCYGGNLLLGWAGYWFCEPNSVGQLLFFQVGNAFAISGAVMAARYTGLRGHRSLRPAISCWALPTEFRWQRWAGRPSMSSAA